MKPIKIILFCAALAHWHGSSCMEVKKQSEAYTFEIIGKKAEKFDKTIAALARRCAGDIPNGGRIKVTCSYNISLNTLKEAFNSISYRHEEPLYEKPLHVLDLTDFLQIICGDAVQKALAEKKKKLDTLKKSYKQLLDTIEIQNAKLKELASDRDNSTSASRTSSIYQRPVSTNAPRAFSTYQGSTKNQEDDETSFIEEYAPTVLLGISCVAFGLALPKIAQYALPPVKQFIFSYLHRN